MEKQTAGRKLLGDFAPEFAHLNDDILFGEVWARDALSLRDRSLITVISLMAQGLTDASFENHLKAAKANGITKSEIAEIITHAAFYCGWPKAWAAFRMAKEIWTETVTAGDAMTEHGSKMIFPIGLPNEQFKQYFIGQSYLAPLNVQAGVFNVTFEPKCRNNWHIHHADKGGGQMLICVAGDGWYQEWGKEAQSLKAGDVVMIPANVKHWHGAKKDSWFSHIAIEIPAENGSAEWCEPVFDDHYENL
ncbi:MAG: carboxymuconolactone decarboxylase family protein [Roseburia sp.]|nr:carboxymuconolactone decarboxylase family protein [Roseburia sp.]